jgi:hypothetical protein
MENGGAGRIYQRDIPGMIAMPLHQGSDPSRYYENLTGA